MKLKKESTPKGTCEREIYFRIGSPPNETFQNIILSEYQLSNDKNSTVCN